MIRAAQVIILIPFGFGVAFGQSADTLSEFEVASIKPSPPPGPGPHPVPRARIPDPSLFVCDSCTLSDLVRGAYDIRPYQLSCPSRMESERFTVNAKVPRGTTREQLQIMQQNLLQARFKLAGHHESAEMQQFELVTAKGGPKLKPSVGPPEDVDDSMPRQTGSSKVDDDGFPVLPATPSTGGNDFVERPRCRALYRLVDERIGRDVVEPTPSASKSNGPPRTKRYSV